MAPPGDRCAEHHVESDRAAHDGGALHRPVASAPGGSPDASRMISDF